MPSLAKDADGWELEDLVAAEFASRGCFVETSIHERGPAELFELDIVRTDYSTEPPVVTPVEVKSGDWGVGDVFKFFGWTQYLGLPPGEFVHKIPCGRIDVASIEHIRNRTGIQFLQGTTPEDVDRHSATLGLRAPSSPYLPDLWRYSFWVQRRLLRSLNVAIQQNICGQSAREAKRYHKLVNDAVFFLPDPRDRVGALLEAHLEHQQLGLSAAWEIETGQVEFRSPPQCKTFKSALFTGQHIPVQACLYLGHRGRLSVLKAVVDYWLARERGDLKQVAVTFDSQLIDLTEGRLSSAMASGAKELSKLASFRLFPSFWQTFLWTWGGFLLLDRLEEEYDSLSRETGVPIAEIPAALTAFDRLFPTDQGWFRQPSNDTRKCLILMPAGIRGLGAYRRTLSRDVESYSDLGLTDSTPGRMASDHNVLVRQLDCPDDELSK